ncbi:MAG: ferredoxin--NADP reductase [Flavobacteriales bacterium]|jgi:ring-1,2-phenylacetyl-CoA epoxidase subunit PaaE|nr:ferredoxin--NADP reductase [Flavobacteriales bacterium]
MSKLYPLRVSNVQKETEEAVVVSFDVPEELYEIFDYKAGQYLTLQFTLNGEEVRRSYSLCSSPAINESLQIGVKRVKNGLVSNHINDHIKSGDTIMVLPPEGRFYAEIKKEQYKTYYLFAAGSGITPILSILKTVLTTEPRSFVHLLFGNRNQESVLFKAEIDHWQEQFPERLIVAHYLSKPKTSWFSSKKEWEYREGRVNEKAITWFVNTYPPYAQNAEYYICGPGKMIENTQQFLQKIDVPISRIFKESFGGAESKTVTQIFEKAQLKARLNGEEIITEIPKETTILRALIQNGNQPPYSCEGGVCSSCICKLTSGAVSMKKNLSLTEEEVAKGYILSCQSLPTTEKVEVVFD